MPTKKFTQPAIPAQVAVSQPAVDVPARAAVPAYDFEYLEVPASANTPKLKATFFRSEADLLDPPVVSPPPPPAFVESTPGTVVLRGSNAAITDNTGAKYTLNATLRTGSMHRNGVDVGGALINKLEYRGNGVVRQFTDQNGIWDGAWNGTAIVWTQIQAPGTSPPVSPPPTVPPVSPPPATGRIRPYVPNTSLKQFFFDDFDTLDTTKWRKCEFNNTGVDFYIPNNVTVGNSVVRIESSGGLFGWDQSQAKQLMPFKRGDYVAASIRTVIPLPTVPGIHIGFWSMPYPMSADQWWQRGELDMVEMISNAPGSVHSTIHYNANGAQGHNSNHHKAYSPPLNAWDGQFHTHAVWWKDDGFYWYFDGRLVHQTGAEGPRGDSPQWRDKTMFMWLSTVHNRGTGAGSPTNGWYGQTPANAPIPVCEFDWAGIWRP